MKRDGLITSAAFSLVAAFVFLSTQYFLQNMHITTTNGLWKSIQLRDFMAAPGWRNIDPSNALLFPLHAFFGKIYDQLSIFPGVRWRQMGVTNGLFGAFAAGVSYFFAYRWTRDRLLAALTACAYCFSGFFVLHSVINEDIMPAFAFVLLAMLLAGEWLGKPTPRRIVVVGVIFCIGWLIEWRVMFPSLPPLCLALFIAPGTNVQRMLRVLLFLLVMLLVPLAFSLLSWIDGYRSFNDAVHYTRHLLWTGKGIGSGYAGFSVDKLWLLASGMSEAIFGGRYPNDPRWLSGSLRWSTLAGLALFAVMLVLGVWYAWQNRSNPETRARFVLIYGLLLAGGVFNAYVQPADPQFQINVMIVALPGWALIIGTAFALARRPDRSAAWRALPVAATILAATPIAFSYDNMSLVAGKDAKEVAYIAEIETRLDLTRTVILYDGQDGTITWIAVKTGDKVPNVMDLSPAPSSLPTFKWMDYVSAAISHPNWSGEQHAEDVIKKINHAMKLGYKVVVPDYWNDEKLWAFTGIASAEKAKVIRSTLHAAYSATPFLKNQFGSNFLELHRR